MIIIRTANWRYEEESLQTPTAKRLIHQFGNRSVACSDCQLASVNGIIVHEYGCPEAWRDEIRECKWCGRRFAPERKESVCCSRCCECAYNGTVCDCPDCFDPEEDK